MMHIAPGDVVASSPIEKTPGITGPTLGDLAAAWKDIQQTRIALAQRGLDVYADMLQNAENHAASELQRQLRKHIMWPWLSQFSGLGGAHTARLLAIIGNPTRFPGQACSEGHLMPPKEMVDGACPQTNAEGEPCPGTMGEPRRGTGVRALWHYCGLHVVDGRAPRRQRGRQITWNPSARTSLMQPGGIAEQIVRHRTPVYREIYDLAKERLTTREAIRAHENDPSLGLPPHRIDRIARTIAAKAFVGDLLVEWKKVVEPPAHPST